MGLLDDLTLNTNYCDA